MYATSQGDSSSNDETTLTSEQAARILQSHFDCGGGDPRSTNGIPMETRSRRRCSVEIAGALSKSRTVSSRTTSQCRLVRGKGAFRGEVRDDDILIDIDEVFARPKVLSKFGAWRHSLRLRFPPHQAEVDACTQTIDRGIQDTHLQHGLKDHSSAPTWKGEVCCIPFLVIQIPIICICSQVASDVKCRGVKGSMAGAPDPLSS